jgi:transcriptional regulator of aromatic amino acid metabolism
MTRGEWELADGARHRLRLIAQIFANGSAAERDLFGREEDAYTGAMTKQIGRFELAKRLDIVPRRDWGPSAGSPDQVVAPAARRTVRVVGKPRTLTVTVRLIAATNHDLAALIMTHGTTP